MERATDGAKGLIDSLRRTFATFGIPDELASDGGPEFVSHLTRKFLQEWGVHHRLSSVAYPHSNCRAEIAVKTTKRLISGNTDVNGTLDLDKFQQAILQYRNAPDAATKQSPAMCIFGRPTKDLIPILPGKYRPHKTWQDSMNTREIALRKRHMAAQEFWSEHTKSLPELHVGDHVRLQNQVGNHPNKWDKTGKVIEVHQHHQYLVKVDGSGRSSIRNRKYLRKFTPINQQTPRRSIDLDLLHFQHPNPPTDPTQHTALPPTPNTITQTPTLESQPPETRARPEPDPEPEPQLTTRPEPPPTPTRIASPTPPTPQPLRRSTRTRKQPDWLS